MYYQKRLVPYSNTQMEHGGYHRNIMKIKY